MPRTLPALPKPMLCTLVANSFDDPDWIFEPKLDGLRVLCRFDGKRVALISRNDKEQNFQFPEIVEGLQKSLKKAAIVDGEIVCLDDRGQSSFRALQQRFHITDAAEVRRRRKAFPAYIYLFDILYFDGEDVRSQPLEKRKKILKRAVKWNDRIRYTDGVAGRGTKLLNDICRRGGEGIVGKRVTSAYADGRSESWVKIKCSSRQEFVIGGFTDPQRSRVGLGALLVGYYDDGKFAYAGKVGTGFNRESLLDLRAQLDEIEQQQSPFETGPRPPGGLRVHWVKPQLVAEIAFGEWTQNDILRQPRFEGLRMDKKAKQVRRERAKSVAPAKRAKEKRKTTKGKGTSRSSVAAPPSARVQFTHTDRVVFPDAGYTKGDVIDFYLRVADKLLPHLRDRPVTLERLPEGVKEGSPHFWQKNTPGYYPSWIPRTRQPTDTGKPVDYVLINDAESLMWLVNQNVMTFHTWFSRVKAPDRPDFVLFDIDPHQSTFTSAVAVAKVCHEILSDEEKVESFIKTTGKSGLHVMVPWRSKGGYDEARPWAEKVAARVAETAPKIATVERMIAKRGNRVYVDAMQNAKGKHSVPPYVLRATPAATVSMPLEWKELTAKLSPKQFDLKTAVKRIERMKKDPLLVLTGAKR